MTSRKNRSFFAVLLPDCYPISLSHCYRNSAASRNPVTWVTVARCLDDMGYSLQANRKTQEGPQHAHRDAPFRYIHRQVQGMLKAGDPVISVDAKKKELVGRFNTYINRF